MTLSVAFFALSAIEKAQRSDQSLLEDWPK